MNSIYLARVSVERVRESYPEEAWSKWMKPEGIADVILFLASGLLRALNGIEIKVFGNFCMR